MTKALIFDFFGVICSEVAPVWIKARLPQESAEELHERYIHAIDEGHTTDVEMFRKFAELAGLTEEEVRKEWQDLISINTEVIDLIRTRKQSYKIGLCSNAWSSFIRPILEFNDLTELFDSIVISSELHVTKPDARIYKEILSALESSASEAVFIDDNPSNVQGAEKVGMQGILFTSVQALIGHI